jgi:molecular chaperone GrpE (heat shock protein)
MQIDLKPDGTQVTLRARTRRKFEDVRDMARKYSQHAFAEELGAVADSIDEFLAAVAKPEVVEE